MTRLGDPDWLNAEPTQHVMRTLEAARPASARFVGGCVRNALLKEPVGDIDIATQLTPDRVSTVLKAAGCAVHPTGIDHGTVTVVSKNTTFEITTLRRDLETDGRHATVAFTESWNEDAQRRDFTVNALYADADGEVFDPTGAGLRDIAARKIAFVGDADTRLTEDYLRILRFFRFFAWYGEGAPDSAGLAACTRQAAGLDGISAERIWAELKKLLGAPAPMSAINAMRDAGVLKAIMPEASELDRLFRLVDIEARDKRAPDPLLRILALAPIGERGLADFARRMKVSNEERKQLLAPLAPDGEITPAAQPDAVRQMAYRVGAKALAGRLMLLRAEQPDHEAAWRAQLAALNGWSRPDLPVGGADVIAAGVDEGPAIGPILRKVEDEWVASDFTLTREHLLTRIRQMASG